MSHQRCRISYYAALTTTAHAAFSPKKAATTLLNATNLDRKSGIRAKKKANPNDRFCSLGPEQSAVEGGQALSGL